MKRYINLEMPSVIGMGAVGPTIALITATLYSAFDKVLGVDWLYPVIMLGLSGALAIFPTSKAQYNKLLKMALWPVATAIIFASAWTSSTGMSMGEEKVANATSGFSIVSNAPDQVPSRVSSIGVPMAPTSTETNMYMTISGLPEYNNTGRSFHGGFFKRMK